MPFLLYEACVCPGKANLGMMTPALPRQVLESQETAVGRAIRKAHPLCSHTSRSHDVFGHIYEDGT